MDKNDNQEMLMDWEKQMYAEIESKIDKEIELHKKNNVSVNKKINGKVIMNLKRLYSPQYYALYKKRRIEEEVYVYRMAYTLSILEKCGLNLEKFEASTLFNSARTDLMLDHIQGKIDGYDLYLTGEKVDPHFLSNLFYVRKSNGNPLDVNNLSCKFKDNKLILESNGERFEYSKDEHCLIYLNDKVIIRNDGIPTPEEMASYFEALDKQSKIDSEMRANTENKTLTYYNDRIIMR